MFRFTRKPKTAKQTPVHPLNQFATVLTADVLAQYLAIKASNPDLFGTDGFQES